MDEVRVDYAGSDDDDINGSQNEEYIHAEVISNSVKRLKSANKDNKTRSEFYKQNDDVLLEECDGITNAEKESSILLNLPPSVPLADKPVQQEEELDDLVKQKDWELRLAKKAERKRKRHRLHNANNTSENHHLSKNLSNDKMNAKEMVIIRAFSGLKGLAGGRKQRESEAKQPDQSMVVSSSTGLLSVLPEPKNASRIPRNLNLFTSTSKHSTGNAKMPEVLTVEKTSNETKSVEEECDDASDEDDSSDFFGLKTVNDPPLVSNIATVSGISSGKEPEQAELTADVKVENNVSAFFSHPGTTADCYDTSSSTTLSGAIDDNQALRMIYSRDVAHLGGTISNAAEAMGSMIDVSVDKVAVLGPNVHATLLKNLHNKSLAEATLSHLANVPKSKDIGNVVARRKHQITYLASIAVAREEQLAEQWSVNRHNKRTSARKYGF
uniref:Proline-rich protein PRCC n=1 Tax=Elaeophora elaphi TaxID=1147741 RepID=A0A0R3S2F4_9BILA